MATQKSTIKGIRVTGKISVSDNTGKSKAFSDFNNGSGPGGVDIEAGSIDVMKNTGDSEAFTNYGNEGSQKK
ncbi:hypothetical protein ACE6H2_001159 [Prunus campanulata]